MEHNTHIKSLRGHGVRVYRRSNATTPSNTSVISPGSNRATGTAMSASTAGTSGTGSSSSAATTPAVVISNAARRMEARENRAANAVRPPLGPMARFKASALFRTTASISHSIERRIRSLMNRHRDSYRPAEAAGVFNQTEGIGGLVGIDITLPIRRTGISLIMNGSICPSGEHGVQPYFVKNSCPFDSVIVAIANAYMDYEQYAEFVDIADNEFLHLAKELGMFGPSKEVYDKRLELLLPFFKFVVDTYYSTPPTLRTLDVECNVWKIVQDYLKRDPSSIMVKTCSNEDGCPGGLERIRYSASVVLSDYEQIRNRGFSCLQEMMEAYIAVDKADCLIYGCDGVVETKRLLGRHVFVETDALSTDEKKYKCPLSEIPPHMLLAGDNYVLQSVIHFTSFHYMTYVRRPLGHWEMHNDMQSDIRIIKKLEKEKVCPHAVVYIKL